ncbi:MAG TPA: ATP phosphoribosyltransferase regulatory subunit [Myxococcaceae bacterium]|jgi:hypothetical protein
MAENEALLRRIGAALKTEDPVDALARQLPATDLASLLLHVFAARTEGLEARKLLQRFEALRAAQPNPNDPRALNAIAGEAYGAASAFEAVELGPVLPLGAAHALGGVHQNNVLGAGRGLEVIADTSDALALEIARRRRALSATQRLETTTRLCGEHRVLRLQPLPDPRLLPHFRLFAFASAGRDGPTAFALSAAREHLAAHLTCFRRLNQRGYAIGALTAQVTDTEVVRWLLERAKLDPEAVRSEIRAHHFGGSAELLASRGVRLPSSAAEAMALPDLPVRLRARLERLESHACAPLRAEFPDVEVAVDLTRLEGLAYYDGLAMRVTATTARGERFPLADGGALDWMARMLGDGKERMVASGFGPDLIASLFRP